MNSKITSTKRVVHLIKTGFLSFFFFALIQSQAFSQSVIFPAVDVSGTHLYAYNKTTGNVGRIYTNKGITSTFSAGLGPFGQTLLYNGDYYGYFDLGKTGLSLARFDENGLVELDATFALRSVHDIIEMNGKIYTLATTNSSSTTDVHVYEYDPNTSSTTKITSSLHDCYKALDLEVYNSGSGNKLYFGGRSSASNSYSDLYNYDGTNLAVAPNFNYSTPYYMAVFNGELHLGASPSGQDSDSRSVKYNGSSSSQVLVTNTNTGLFLKEDLPQYYIVFNNKLYFKSSIRTGSTSNDRLDNALYSVNTSGNVTKEYEIPKPADISTINGPSYMFESGGSLYFIADDNLNSDSELFRFNSTNNVTKVTNTTNQRFIQSPRPYDGGVFFWQERVQNDGNEPYYFNLSDNTYTSLGDIKPGTGSSYSSTNFGANKTYVGELAPYVYVPESSVTVRQNTASLVTTTLEVVEIDNNSFTAVSVEIVSGFQSGDVLAVTDQHGITSSYNASSGVLTLGNLGSATPAQVQDVLNSLKITASNTTTKSLVYKATDSDNNTNDITNTTAAKVDAVVSTLVLSNLTFDAQPNRTSTITPVGSFTISDSNLGEVVFKTTNDPLSTAFESLTLQFASDNGLRYDDNNKELQVLTDDNAASPIFSAFKADNEFNFQSFSVIDRQFGLFDRYIVTGLLNGSQEFQETFNVAAPTVKETLTTSSTNRAKNVNEIRVEGVYSTDPDSYGFGAHLDNILVALPAAANTAPAFESDLSGGSHTVSLEENSPLGKLVYNVSANDGDGGSTDTGVTYSITAGNTNQDSDNSSSSVSANLLPFKIDNATGQIYVNDPGDLNFEGTNSFALTIEASDGANQTTATLTINLTDQTESGPIDGEYRFTTGDGWPSTYTDATTHTGTYFSLISQSSGNIQMIASDEGFWLNNNTDLANGTIRVQADGTDMTEFDLADVMVYKYNNALITAGSFSVTFTGHKSAGSTVSTTGINTSGDSGWSTLPEFSDFTALDYFDIAITDTESGTNNLINYGFHRLYFANSKSTPPNTAPVITASQSFDVTEDAANSTAVGTVVATDADSDPLSSWTITAGNGDGIFAVNSGTGAITVTDNTNLDYETTTSYTLTLTVSDGSATSSAQTVTVNVTDVDEVAPVFENSTPSSSAITQTGFALSTDIDEAGIIYYVVVSNGVGVPTSAQVKAGQNSSGGSPITSGNAAVTTGGFTNDFSVTGLTAGTDYDVYVVAQDDEATPNIQTNPTKVAVSTITQSSSQNISTLYGTTVGYSGDGNLATNAKIDGPTDLVYDTSGNLFFVDGRNNVVRKIDTNGIITTIAGNGTQGYSGDGGLATSAQLNAPYGITFDTNDNLFISEIGNHTIRKIDSNGIITTIAGNGTPGYSGDGGLATSAQLHAPYGITFDTNDNLFIGERNNNIIRKVDTNGIITTIAGNGTPGYSGDGGLAINALLGGCRSVAFNDNGDLYISDGNNHAVRKIDVNGIITTVAGNGTQGYSGDGSLATSAKINFPRFVIFDNFDNFYFSESSSHVIRKVDNTGKISTVAGNGTQGYSGDGGLATSAQLNGPFGIILDSKDVGGNLIFCDNNNNVIRKVENVVIDNSPKTLIVTGLAGNNKEYDGTTDATAIGTASLSGVIGTDNVSLVGSPIFTFASSNVGTGITVTTTGYTLSGTDAGKYSLTQPILLSDITAKELTITGSTGDDKVYDGTTAATSSGTPSLSGLIGTDDVSLGGSPVFTFASANVGTVITITTTGYSISGTDLGNYSLTQPTLSADITAKSLSVTGLTGEDKVYDGATAATSSGTPVLSGVIGTDDVILGGSPVFTFASASAGTGITIISTGYSISGTEVANYSLTQPTLSADITAKSLTITGLTGDNKVYDGTASATVSGTAALSGVVGIDDVSLGDSPVFTFASGNVATGIAITTTGLTISGKQAGNYVLTQPTLSADITEKSLTITGLTGDNKAYDGTTTATASGTASLSGVIGADDVSIGGSPVFTFASANVGTVITITTTGYSISGTEAINYSLTQPTLLADITAKPLSITGITGDDKIYDGTTAATSSGTPVLSGVIGTDDVILGGSPVFTFASASAGTGITIISTGYSISGTEVANYSLTQPTLSADITEKSLTITGLTGDNKVYDGTASATVSGTAALSGVVGIDDVSLGDSPVFTFASANVATGIAITTTGLTISGKQAGNYVLTQPTLSADITEKSLTITGLTGDNKAYDGTTTATASGTASLSGVIGADDVSIGGSPVFTFASANVGTVITITTTGYSISGTEAINYSLTQPTLLADITAKPLSITGITGDDKIYDGTTAATFSGTASLSGVIGADDVSLGGSPVFTFANASAGTGITIISTGYSISGTEVANYSLTQPTLSADITEKSLTITGLTGDNKVYDGTASATVSGTAALSGVVGIDDVSLGDSPVFTFASANVATGIAITTTGLTISGKQAGNYVLTQLTLSADITEKSLTVTADANQTKVYGATDPTFSYTLTGSLETGDAFTGSLARAAGENVGTYAINIGTLSAGSNYNVTFAGSDFSITAKPITVTAVAATKVYGDADPTLTYNITSGALNTGDELSGTITRVVGNNVGTYALESSLFNGNYDITFESADLTITKKALTATADDKSRTYGEINPELTITYEGFVNGEAATALGDGLPFARTTATAGSSAGTYAITLSGSDTDNYTVNLVDGTLTVGKASLTATADDKSRTYGEANPQLTITYEGFVNGDDATSLADGVPFARTTATAVSPAGTYAITLSGSDTDNYTVNLVDGTLTVGKASLTATADDKSRTYGEANPELTITYEGFVNGDEATALGDGLPFASTTATAGSPAGTYAITLTGSDTDNYTVNLVDGTLTVGKASLTATADDKNRTYGEANPELTITYEGFVNGDDATSLADGVPFASTTATSVSSAGTYAITLSGSDTDNYTVNLVDGTLTVGKASLTASADDKSRTYGEANPELTITYEGFVNGDDAIALADGVPFASTTATAGSSAGTYAITLSGSDTENYTVSLVDGTLTVGKASLTATADNKSRTYGEANPELTITYEGFVNGEAATALGDGLPFASTTATAGSSAGTFAITLTGSDTDNYTVNLVDGTLTVGKASLTARADDKSRTYGEANPELTITYEGFVNGDDATALGDGLPFASTTATAGSPAGTYAITLTGSDTDNYTVNLVDGTLTVGKATITATADAKSREYGETNPTLTITYAGFQNGESETVIDTAPTASTTATATTNVGTAAAITLAGGSDNNYDITLVNGALTIGKATVTATADNQSRLFGTANPTLTISYAGFKNGETEAVLDTKPIASTTADINTAVGTADIILTGGSDNNYELVLVNGELTVNALNNVPTIANPIADQTEIEGFRLLTIDLINVFTDVDEDALTFTAVSSNTSIASVSVSGFNLDISEESTGTVTITVTAEDGRGGIATDEFSLSILEAAVPQEAEIPQGFSPNGDGVNDMWQVPNIENFPNNTVTIFDRQGNKVYQARGYNNADVSFEGLASSGAINKSQGLADGVYYYIIDLGNGESRKGSIIIKQ